MGNQVPVAPSGGTPMPRGAPNTPTGFLPTYGTSVDYPPAPCGTSPGTSDKQPGGTGLNPVVPAPFSVSAVAPSSGLFSGGTAVTLTGLGMTGITSVKFDGAVAALGANTATTQAVTTPAGAVGRNATITVTGPNGTITIGDGFLYTA